MKFAIVASKQDLAGMNIVEELRKLTKELRIIEADERIIYLENIDEEKNIKEDFVIFASKHSSKVRKKTLSIHAPGNWHKAELGGKVETVCKTSALFLKHLFKILNKNNPSDSEYIVTLECTHHGPLITKPCCFIEIGGSEKEWKDKKAAQIIAKTIVEAIEREPEEATPVIAIGGPHYCPVFNKVQLNSKYAISHIIPQYALPITEQTLSEAIEKTLEKVELVIIDWKGLGNAESRKKIIDLLESLDIEYIRTSGIKK